MEGRMLRKVRGCGRMGNEYKVEDGTEDDAEKEMRGCKRLRKEYNVEEEMEDAEGDE